MARIRAAHITGTVSNDPLAIGATELSSSGLSNLPEVEDPDIAVISLDPKGENGNPEIVYVTAHTAEASTATILRAQEGTGARSHPQGTDWVHGPTDQDFSFDQSLNMQVFTENGTFTVPDGVTHIYAIVVGGGGGGGSAVGANSGSDNWAAGGGGAGGGSAEGPLEVTPGQEIAATIGEAGLGGVATGTTAPGGGQGGESSFDVMTATGGAGGNGAVGFGGGSRAQAGVGTGGTLNLPGGEGGPGLTIFTIEGAVSGGGGDSRFGYGGPANPSFTFGREGLHGHGYGAGGSGATGRHSSTQPLPENGGDGAPGVVVIRW